MARKSSGKKSSSRAAQRESAKRHNANIIDRIFSNQLDKPLVFGRVEAARGNAQFSVILGSGQKVQATPLGVFTVGSCPIVAGHVVVMEPAQKADQVHLIVARIDTMKTVKQLIKMGKLTEALFADADGDESKIDDLFDYEVESEGEIDVNAI
jgi:translation initiation factor IF-1